MNQRALKSYHQLVLEIQRTTADNFGLILGLSALLCRASVIVGLGADTVSTGEQ